MKPNITRRTRNAWTTISMMGALLLIFALPSMATHWHPTYKVYPWDSLAKIQRVVDAAQAVDGTVRFARGIYDWTNEPPHRLEITGVGDVELLGRRGVTLRGGGGTPIPVALTAADQSAQITSRPRNRAFSV